MKMKVGIVGTGLIGGSLAIDLKENHASVIGFDSSDANLQKALQLGLIDQASSIDKIGSVDLDVIIMAVPVDAIVSTLPEVLNSITSKTTVIDVGSTKEQVCASVSGNSKREQFVAAHPIAGTENVGPEGAIPALFRGKQNIVCDKDHSGNEHLEKALGLFELLGMKTIYMDSREHDKHLAYVSHLSHISSFMLGQTVLDIERSEKNIKTLAGSGFDSTVRLAKSSPNMWAPIFLQNKTYVLESLNQYIKHLESFRNLISEDDRDGLLNAMGQANDIRRILK